MGLLDELLTKLGAMADRAHIFSFTKVRAAGVYPSWRRELRPLPESGLTAGHLLELYAVLDERHDIASNAAVRFDVLEEDWLFSGGLDDRVISLLGDGAVTPETGAPTRNVSTSFHEFTDGEDPIAFVEEFKRTVTLFGDDYAN